MEIMYLYDEKTGFADVCLLIIYNIYHFGILMNYMCLCYVYMLAKY